MSAKRGWPRSLDVTRHTTSAAVLMVSLMRENLSENLRAANATSPVSRSFRDLFSKLCSAVSVTRYDPSRQPMASQYFRKTRKFTIATGGTGWLKLIRV